MNLSAVDRHCLIPCVRNAVASVGIYCEGCELQSETVIKSVAKVWSNSSTPLLIYSFVVG